MQNGKGGAQCVMSVISIIPHHLVQTKVFPIWNWVRMCKFKKLNLEMPLKTKIGFEKFSQKEEKYRLLDFHK